MGRTIRVEYGENQFVEMEQKQDFDDGGGLGGREKIIKIGQKVFDGSIMSIVAFLNATADKVKQGVTDKKASEISITAGASLNGEGNFVIASSAVEVNFSISITFKAEE